MMRPAPTAGRGRHGTPAPITTDRLVAALAGAALLISLYLAITQLVGRSVLFCERGGGSDVVQSSGWATFFGAPTAAWGAVHFALLLALALAGFTARRRLLAFVLAAVGVGFSGSLRARRRASLSDLDRRRPSGTRAC